MRPEYPRSTQFGKWLALLRQEQGYTVTSLADMANVAVSSVSDIELGKRKLTSRMARMLAGPLDIHPNELLKRGSLTAEFAWELTISPHLDNLTDLHLKVTTEEQRKLTEYLEFLRFKGAMSGSLSSHEGIDPLQP